MAKIVNLRQARKRKRRAVKENVAAEKRIRHGRSAGEKAAIASQDALAAKRLDGHRRETPKSAASEDAEP